MPAIRLFYHWVADTFRLFGALFYWNARKSIYVLGGRQGQCPCHDRSDSGHPGETHCEAVWHWHKPARFRRVCPLLQLTPDGWRCSVAPSGVRPFWGRALRISSLFALVLVLLAGCGTYALLRATVGPSITPLHVFWPGKWREIRVEQSRAFQQKAMVAFSRRAYRQATLELASSLERDPGNYEAALLLSQIAQFQGNHDFADKMFERLLREFPAQRKRTALVFHDTLLGLWRSDALAKLSLRMALADPDNTAVWVRSLLLALRLSAACSNFIVQNKETIGRLPAHAILLVNAVDHIAAGKAAAAVELLRQPFAGPWNQVYIQQQLSLLLHLRQPDAAQRLLGLYAVALPATEQSLMAYATGKVAGEDMLARLDLAIAMRLPDSAYRTARLASVLIDYPDRAAFQQFDQFLTSDAGRLAKADPVALWAAALACGEPREADYWAAEAKARTGLLLPPIRRINYDSQLFEDPASPAYLVNSLPLGREIIYSLVQQTIAKPGWRPR
ncbi:MAG: hypothetical protein PSU94_05370 [Lacunisphaera sp.]|nr:hypothetical protein [Lacunisphaera sp.]